VNSAIFRDFSELEELYADKRSGLAWPQVFCLPGWMKSWWKIFGSGYELSILVARHDDRVIGVAPFKRQGCAAAFIGDAEICDYLDFIVVPGLETIFCETLIEECAACGISRIQLGTLRPDSIARRFFLPFAQSQGLVVECHESDVSYEMTLPASYEIYLDSLSAKQRREALRKQRNLDTLGGMQFKVLRGNEIKADDMEVFLNLMAGSRKDKAGFLTETMRDFFREIVQSLFAYGVLRLACLELGEKRVAAVLGFEYNNIVFLYNSGYDTGFAGLSVGLISKMEFIRWSIEQRALTFDFLKGPEVYKERLGGRKLSLSSCTLAVS
jgi:CelD/BcsL family acetyltransferase involved in cellulose biosynthesis